MEADLKDHRSFDDNYDAEALLEKEVEINALEVRDMREKAQKAQKRRMLHVPPEESPCCPWKSQLLPDTLSKLQQECKKEEKHELVMQLSALIKST